MVKGRNEELKLEGCPDILVSLAQPFSLSFIMWVKLKSWILGLTQKNLCGAPDIDEEHHSLAVCIAASAEM